MMESPTPAPKTLDVQKAKDWLGKWKVDSLLILVAVAFVLNIVTYLSLPAGTTNLYKLLTQQALILIVWSIGAKLDRLLPK